MELTIHGARGSVPTSKPEQRLYGGSTPCLEIDLGPRHRVLLDCGTGLLDVAAGAPNPVPSRYDVFFSHYHLDHLIGLPFFAPLYSADARFDFHGFPWNGRPLQETLESLLRPPWFPVALDQTPSSKRYLESGDATIEIDALRLTGIRLPHPQGVTAWRLRGPRATIVYATDYERGDAASDARLRELAAGADVLIHDAQYTPEEYDEDRRGWGHSTWRHAVDSAREARVRRLVLFHHDPRRSDAELDEIVRRARKLHPCTEAAKGGMRLPL